MSTHRYLPYLCFAAALVASPAVLAQSCKPDVAWSHVLNQAESDAITDDIKGSRATRIEVCREKAESGAQLKVTLQFEHEREARELAQGMCLDKFAKWAILRSRGTRNADGSAAEAKGVYRLCRE